MINEEVYLSTNKNERAMLTQHHRSGVSYNSVITEGKHHIQNTMHAAKYKTIDTRRKSGGQMETR